MPSFRRVVEALGDAWDNERAQVLEQADALVGAVARELRLAEALQRGGGRGRKRADGAGYSDWSGTPAGQRPLDPDALVERVVAGVAAGFDPEWGGFGPAPKFPRPSLVELCLRRARRGGSDAAHARHDGHAHARRHGGRRHLRPPRRGVLPLLDDGRWLVPTSRRCSPTRPSWPAPICTPGRTAVETEYLGVVTETLDFVLRDLSTPEGALFSSFDADAGGIEGAHATFTMEELREILPASLVAPARSGTASPRAAIGRDAPSPSVLSGPR